METLSVKITNQRPEIARLSGILEEFMDSHDVPMNVSFAIDLAMDELLTNIITYGFPEDGYHEIDIDFELSDEEIAVKITDDGIPFNPLEQEDADTTLSIDEREIGGLGIHLVKKTMNSMEYQRSGNKNVLTLKKSIASVVED
ncbi:MAG: ATP-binding protein [Bacteroidetes bacterium]|nr:ATP-binding protein [Bacteroidota bacterium]